MEHHNLVMARKKFDLGQEPDVAETSGYLCGGLLAGAGAGTVLGLEGPSLDFNLDVVCNVAAHIWETGGRVHVLDVSGGLTETIRERLTARGRELARDLGRKTRPRITVSTEFPPRRKRLQALIVVGLEDDARVASMRRRQKGEQGYQELTEREILSDRPILVVWDNLMANAWGTNVVPRDRNTLFDKLSRGGTLFTYGDPTACPGCYLEHPALVAFSERDLLWNLARQLVRARKREPHQRAVLATSSDFEEVAAVLDAQSVEYVDEETTRNVRRDILTLHDDPGVLDRGPLIMRAWSPDPLPPGMHLYLDVQDSNPWDLAEPTLAWLRQADRCTLLTTVEAAWVRRGPYRRRRRRTYDDSNIVTALLDPEQAEIYSTPGWLCHNEHVTLTPLADFFRLVREKKGVPSAYNRTLKRIRTKRSVEEELVKARHIEARKRKKALFARHFMEALEQLFKDQNQGYDLEDLPSVLRHGGAVLKVEKSRISRSSMSARDKRRLHRETNSALKFIKEISALVDEATEPDEEAEEVFGHQQFLELVDQHHQELNALLRTAFGQTTLCFGAPLSRKERARSISLKTQLDKAILPEHPQLKSDSLFSSGPEGVHLIFSRASTRERCRALQPFGVAGILARLLVHSWWSAREADQKRFSMGHGDQVRDLGLELERLRGVLEAWSPPVTLAWARGAPGEGPWDLPRALARHRKQWQACAEDLCKPSMSVWDVQREHTDAPLDGVEEKIVCELSVEGEQWTVLLLIPEHAYPEATRKLLEEPVKQLVGLYKQYTKRKVDFMNAAFASNFSHDAGQILSGPLSDTVHQILSRVMVNPDAVRQVGSRMFKRDPQRYTRQAKQQLRYLSLLTNVSDSTYRRCTSWPARGYDPKRWSVDLNQVVRDAVILYADVRDKPMDEFDIEGILPANTVFVNTDPDSLTVALFRILSNAHNLDDVTTIRISTEVVRRGNFARVRIWDDDPTRFPDYVYDAINSNRILGSPPKEKQKLKDSSHRGLRFIQYYILDQHEKLGQLPRFHIAASGAPDHDRFKTQYIDFPIVRQVKEGSR